MSGVSRDTSADAMAEAPSSLPGTAGIETARHKLWMRREELRDAIEDLMRVARLHAQGNRLAWRERGQTRAAQQRGILALTALDDIEREATNQRNAHEPLRRGCERFDSPVAARTSRYRNGQEQ